MSTEDQEIGLEPATALTANEKLCRSLNVRLKTFSRDRKWYEVDLSRTDDTISWMLSKTEALEELRAGREVKVKRTNGLESRFRFTPFDYSKRR